MSKANIFDDYQLIIFDWDGTLMDSVARIVSSVKACASHFSLPIPSDEAAKNIIGLSLPKAMTILFPNIDNLVIKQMIDEYKAQYLSKDKTPSHLFEHAQTLLKQLHQQGKTLAVATGKGRNGLERVWQATNTKHYFKTSRCADETLSKPDPAMLEEILAELSIPVERAIMVGDTSHDLEMARRANMASLGVSYGVHSREILQQYQPIAIIDSLTELL